MVVWGRHRKFNKLPARDMPNKKVKTTFYHWKYLMTKLQQHYESVTGCIITTINIDTIKADEMYNIVKQCMDPFINETAKRRKRERSALLKITTLASLMYKYENPPSDDRSPKQCKSNK